MHINVYPLLSPKGQEIPTKFLLQEEFIGCKEVQENEICWKDHVLLPNLLVVCFC